MYHHTWQACILDMCQIVNFTTNEVDDDYVPLQDWRVAPAPSTSAPAAGVSPTPGPATERMTVGTGVTRGAVSQVSSQDNIQSANMMLLWVWVEYHCHSAQMTTVTSPTLSPDLHLVLADFIIADKLARLIVI